MASLKSAMIKGCREPPYPSILTDATMEKLALAKFVAQESKCEVRTWGGEAVVPKMQALVLGSRGADSGSFLFLHHLPAAGSPLLPSLATYPVGVCPQPDKGHSCF